MSSPLVHWELEQKYQEITKNGESLPQTFKASEFRAFNPAMGDFEYDYTIEVDMRSNPKGGIIGF